MDFEISYEINLETILPNLKNINQCLILTFNKVFEFVQIRYFVEFGGLRLKLQIIKLAPNVLPQCSFKLNRPDVVAYGSEIEPHNGNFKSSHIILILLIELEILPKVKAILDV